jgi:hypothetical protein
MRWTVEQLRERSELLDASGEALDRCSARELVAKALQGEADEILTPQLAERGVRRLAVPFARASWMPWLGGRIQTINLLDPGDFSSPQARRLVMEEQAFEQLRESREEATP